MTLGADQAGAGEPGAGQSEAGAADRAARIGACLERARTGERAALGEIVRQLNPLLWQVARAQGIGAEEAADVVQTTWLELLRRLHDIRSPQALTGWLVTATRREAWRVRERSRRQAADGAAVLETMPDLDPGPGEQLLTDERDRVLWLHFRRLPERCRRLLGIIAHADRPHYSAVAEALGVPHGSIGPTRGRCLAKLREMLLGDPGWSAS